MYMRGSARWAPRRRALASRQEAVIDARDRVVADDVTLSVDGQGRGQRGAWDVDGREGAVFVEQEAMRDAAGRVLANDVTLSVDTTRQSE
jgi:hypothetical protein